MTSPPPSDNQRPLLFMVGALIFSPGIDRCMREGRLDPIPYFQRHARADWGDVSDEKWQANNDALQSNGRLESFYVVHRELSICIFTEADRSETHIVLAAER
ncbi:hypothetical protein [Pseudomonas sp. B392_1p]|uniref:hypothetical protein n=1 Tax=Pseudomonas sp. B392_1p TaxID=3457507 RepID=UPI003FCF12EE